MKNSNYNHTNIENEIYNYWEKNKFFKPNLVNHVVKEIGINIGHATQ